MKNQSLYLVGGALLASTALSTTAQAAATIKANTGHLSTNLATTAITPFSLATQVFPTTTTTANAISIGPTATTTNTAQSTILIDTSATLTTFDLKLEISTATAAFVTSPVPTVQFYSQSTTGTLEQIAAASVTGCTVQPSAERISILGCNPSAVLGISRIDAVGISGLQYTSAAALRTAGTSVTLSGATYIANSATVIDTITPAVIITSKSAVTGAAVTAGSAAIIDSSAASPFTLLVSSGATTSVSAVLGTVSISGSGALGTDLTTSYLTAASIVSMAEVKVTHSVLTDAALTGITFSNITKSAGQFVSGTVSFTVSGASLNAAAIVASFGTGTGTTAISASSGTLSATVTPLSPAGALVTTADAFSGSLASLSRGGLSVELNSILPGAMSASYVSFLRIANQSTVAGTATVTVKNDATGIAVGSFVTDSIASGATLTLSSSDIDTKLSAAGATVLTSQAYKVTVSGSFNGYVQSLLYNVANQGFADASGFRNGSLTVDP